MALILMRNPWKPHELPLKLRVLQEWVKESNRVGTPLNLIAITPIMQAQPVYGQMWGIIRQVSRRSGRFKKIQEANSVVFLCFPF